ncbi:MAG: iron-containing alcohol dehydrogenase [Oscillospiraceae bacterium]|nr:iron-containing alcohol dehydrogenase [Oscillospiraceae bacterium]
MTDFKKLIASFAECDCGVQHRCDIKDIRVGSGLVREVGRILQENDFPQKLLLVADRNTIRAAEGIVESLQGFEVEQYIYEDLRVATFDDVRLVESYFDRVDGVLAVGTGSIHDPCRMACARQKKPLALFGTAPSMDGFASYNAPLVDGNFKTSPPAKCPEIIIADTKILAESPKALKSAGFGDMVSKYVALIDWQVSHLVTGEHYCEKVAGLTRYATDNLMRMADKITLSDEEAAGAVFESLLMTGIAMAFTQTSRPASGTEHIMAHYWECLELLEGKIPNYHGEDVGVTTLINLKFYNELIKKESIRTHKEINDWDEILSVYGPLAEEVRKINSPDTITDEIDPEKLVELWPEIVKIVQSVPSYEECLAAMKKAGCKTTIEEVGKGSEFVAKSFLYHPYMRRRLSLRRLANMID